MAGKRRWEDMEMDCLVAILQRLGPQDLTLSVPLVCRSWRKASLHPLCWRVLNFRDLDFMPWGDLTKSFMAEYRLQRFFFSGFLKLAVARGNRLVEEIMFPLLFGTSMQDLFLVSDECPRLKKLVLPNLSPADEADIPKIVGKWKDLEQLEMEAKPSSFLEMLSEINLHCKKFSGLKMCGSIKKEDMLAIVNLLPKLKFLCLSKSYLPREQLLGILSGCKELQRLTVSDCMGFEADEEVKKRGLGIKIFEHEGSKLFDDFDYNSDECDPL
ncbi:hypothetical protein C4D60_Mb06t32140 [Musa balbisiana]|uniref:F-box domain-containing protein n=1 Tax=Musa balbisiana TaxID=52838 RepID=A0A4S8IS77_MUSBA|nr:hypothetical protein C4D60_Mb06t32140 [Musa balbisiana]